MILFTRAEVGMRTKPRISMWIGIFALCIPTFILAEDVLFDNKEATKHIEKGVVHLQGKNYDAAIKEFDEASTISPDAEAFYYLGYAFYLKGKLNNDPESRKKSIENFDRAYELDPHFTPNRIKMETTAVTGKRPDTDKSQTQLEPQPGTDMPKSESSEEPKKEL